MFILHCTIKQFATIFPSTRRAEPSEAPGHRPERTPPPTIWLWFRQSPPPFAGTVLRSPPDPPPPAGFVVFMPASSMHPFKPVFWRSYAQTRNAARSVSGGAASRFASVSEVGQPWLRASCHWLQRLLRRNDNPAKLTHWKSLDIGSPPFDWLNTMDILVLAAHSCKGHCD